MKDLKKIQEFFSKPLENISPNIKEGMGNGTLKIEKGKDGKYYWEFTFNSGKVEKWPNGFSDKASAQKDFKYRMKYLKESSILSLDDRIVADIKKSISMGYNQLVVGMIKPKTKGVMLINKKSQVRGTYPLQYKDVIQSIIDKELGEGKIKESNISNKDGEIKLAEAVAGVSQNKKEKARAALSLHLKSAKEEGDKEAEQEVLDARDKIMKASSLKDIANILDEFGYDSNEIEDILGNIDVKEARTSFTPGIIMNEAKKETAVDMVKKKLDALGVKYEMSKTDKVRPFKVIYKPVNKSDEFYDKFEDIVDLFNLKGVVKSSMNEAKSISDYKVGDVISFKDGETWKVVKLTSNGGVLAAPFGKTKDSYISIAIEFPAHVLEKEVVSLNESKKDKQYYKNIAYLDKKGLAKKQFSDKDIEIARKMLSNGEFIMEEAELTEAYVPSNIKEFAKRKGVSSLVNKVAGWAEKVGKGIRGGTAIGYNYSTLILDMTYQGSEIRINTDNDTITLYDEPVYSFNDFKQVYLDNQNIEENVAPNHDGKAAPYGSGYKPLEERIAEALDKINEELCPAGKAYRKRRMAAGEKSSAYLSGRAVKVCKGQMSGKKKKK